MSYIILDIDGCIADDGWRIPAINWHATDPFKRYDEYHKLSYLDPAGNHDLFKEQKHGILLLTSRPVAYRALTERWLKGVGVQWHALLMRNNPDHRPSSVVKHWQVLELWHYGVALSEITCAYDDRPEILSMYRDSFGLRTELRALHDVCAYRNPLTGVNHADGSRPAPQA